MKKILLSVTILFFVTVCHAQKPRRTEVKDAKDKYANQEVAYRKVALNGKILYQKGKCTSLGPRSKICTFCDNAELTENCREYECDNKGWPLRLKTATSGVAERATTNERPKTEDPDQGGEIADKDMVDLAEVVSRKKTKNGAVKLYSSSGKHTVYASFKKGKAATYYAIDMAGKKISATYSASADGVKCYFCIVNDGQGDVKAGKVCYKVKCEDIPSPASSSTIIKSRQ